MRKVLDRALRAGEKRQFKRLEQAVTRIAAWEPELKLLEDHELAEQTVRLGARAQSGVPLDELLAESFALTREAGRRSMGMRHFDVQLIGGMVLHQGDIAEMRTGEGKTLTATLAASLNALSGQGVHVVTVNDYLARRDAEWMSPVYNALGLSVGVLQSGQTHEAKQQAYAADVTYGTNSEFGFDYLRDNLVVDPAERVQQRGLNFAVVDEVDNILIDEARTPLIISGAPEAAANLYRQFARLAQQLQPGKRPENMDARLRKEYVAEYDYEFDEKHHTVAVTERGVEKAERFLGIDHLYRAENGPLVNHLIQALKAQSLYRKDVDYAVVDGEVKIIDEFTGRILEGRRWSEGLHQAVEAKEGVAIQEESQTVASITYQNFFRMYHKLSGMTGTALTEANEFKKIYDLGVVQIPTNRPMVRQDRSDLVYKSRQGKWSAVVEEIAQRHQAGQPVLVGTISVETSELLSSRLSARGVKHTVLNAKPEHAAREADIVAEAGQPGAVTIATNMAGRGVDIKLGGNAEHLAQAQLAKLGLRPADADYQARLSQILPAIETQVEERRQQVHQAGGLFILGTERHESRRIDNQLRGRAGRQGDPGESRFYISAEDDLIRLFAGDRIYRVLDRLSPEGEEIPLESSLLSKQIETAQRKVEEQHFLARKRVLEYDDVMNEQRRVVYALRNRILEGEDLSALVQEKSAASLERIASEYVAGEYAEDWDAAGLLARLGEVVPPAERWSQLELTQHETLTEDLHQRLSAAYQEREQELGEEITRALERFLLLQIIDERWREHLHDMDYLREGIHLRGFAQIEPLIAYKNEAFTLFGELMDGIWETFTSMFFRVEVEREQQLDPAHQPRPAVEQRRSGEWAGVGRNQPCPCGSGKKFKKCHGASASVQA